MRQVSLQAHYLPFERPATMDGAGCWGFRIQWDVRAQMVEECAYVMHASGLGPHFQHSPLSSLFGLSWILHLTSNTRQTTHTMLSARCVRDHRPPHLPDWHPSTVYSTVAFDDVIFGNRDRNRRRRDRTDKKPNRPNYRVGSDPYVWCIFSAKYVLEGWRQSVTPFIYSLGLGLTH